MAPTYQVYRQARSQTLNTDGALIGAMEGMPVNVFSRH